MTRILSQLGSARDGAIYGFSKDMIPKKDGICTLQEGCFLEGFLIRPPGFDAAKKYPVKFLIHGGPQGGVGR